MATKKDDRTLFIRGVSFETEASALEAAFSELGPIKQCFLVKDKEKDKHKGFGFVQYALEEDAIKAVEEFNGMMIDGRKLKVELANKRAPMAERKQRQGKATPDEEGAAAEGAAEEEEAEEGEPKVRKSGLKNRQGAEEEEEEKEEEEEEVPLGKVDKKKKKKGKQAEATKAVEKGEEEKVPVVKAKKVPVGKAEKMLVVKEKKILEAAVAAPSRKVSNKARMEAAAAAAADPKHRLIRSVAVGALTPEVTAQVMKLASSVGEVEEVLCPAPEGMVQATKLRGDGCTDIIAVLVFKTVSEANDAVALLHGRKIVPAAEAAPSDAKKGKKGKKGKKASEEEAEQEGQKEAPPQKLPPVVLWARQVSGEGAFTKKWRIIIRNLPWKISEGQIRAVLKPAGFVWELKIPRGADGRASGFAFAAFTCHAHAEKAIKLSNGKEIGGRMVVVDWAVAKSQFELSKFKKADSPSGDNENSQSGSDVDSLSGSDEDADDDDEDDEEEDEDRDDDGEEDEEESFDMDDEEAEDDEEAGLGEEDEAVQTSRKERSMLHSVLDIVLKENKTQTEGDKPDKEDKVAKGKDAKPASAADKRALEKAEKAKEPPKKQSFEGDHAAGELASKGDGKILPPPDFLNKTVFVRGLHSDVTSVELQARLEAYGPVRMCRVVMNKATGKPKGTAFVEFKFFEAAKKCVAATERGKNDNGPGITLGGQKLDINLAVTQDEARDIASGGLAKKVGKDNRNLFLAKEGDIAESSAAWSNMSESDQQKRQRAMEEKRTKLKSPNFCISMNRLSVRNIPYSLTEAELRVMAIQAVKERATSETPSVREVKILRESDNGKLGSDGLPRSKGMGFVEFEDHTHAVTALRQLNNNPTLFGAERRPIVEFAIENVKILKRKETLVAKQQANREKNLANREKQRASDKEAAQRSKANAVHVPLAPTDAAKADSSAAGKEDGGKDKRKRKASAASETDAPAAGQPPAGSSDAADAAEAARLSKRQVKRNKQKVRADRKISEIKQGVEEKAEARMEAKGGRKQREGRVDKDGKGGREQREGKKADGKGDREQRGRKHAPGEVPKEQQEATQRKRRADNEIDQIAMEGLKPELGRAKRAKPEKEDKLDVLVADYKARLFGVTSAAATPTAVAGGKGAATPKSKRQEGARASSTENGAANTDGAAMRRWFE